MGQRVHQTYVWTREFIKVEQVKQVPTGSIEIAIRLPLHEN